MANTFNGIGTTFYGQSKFQSDDSYVTTKWFVIGFFPLIPLASLRVRYLDTSGIPFLSRSTQFEVLEELPIDWVQVLKIWVYSLFVITVVGSVLVSNLPAPLKVILCSLAVFLPFVVRFFAKRMSGN